MLGFQPDTLTSNLETPLLPFDRAPLSLYFGVICLCGLFDLLVVWLRSHFLKYEIEKLAILVRLVSKTTHTKQLSDVCITCINNGFNHNFFLLRLNLAGYGWQPIQLAAKTIRL